jgi:hypothetical protein
LISEPFRLAPPCVGDPWHRASRALLALVWGGGAPGPRLGWRLSWPSFGVEALLPSVACAAQVGGVRISRQAHRRVGGCYGPVRRRGSQSRRLEITDQLVFLSSAGASMTSSCVHPSVVAVLDRRSLTARHRYSNRATASAPLIGASALGLLYSPVPQQHELNASLRSLPMPAPPPNPRHQPPRHTPPRLFFLAAGADPHAREVREEMRDPAGEGDRRDNGQGWSRREALAGESAEPVCPAAT